MLHSSKPRLYTIGYATKPLDTFIRQLTSHDINVIADVRSVPYSKVFHDYHKEAIQHSLKAAGIRYVYLGDELGPRSKDDSHYDDTGQVRFERLMHAPLFKEGIERLANGLEKGFRIALMCAEKDAATCHRSLLIGYFIQHFGDDWEVQHIDHNGGLEPQKVLEHRLCDIHHCGDDLFLSPDEQRQQAYTLQLNLTSYRKDDQL